MHTEEDNLVEDNLPVDNLVEDKVEPPDIPEVDKHPAYVLPVDNLFRSSNRFSQIHNNKFGIENLSADQRTVLIKIFEDKCEIKD